MAWIYFIGALQWLLPDLTLCRFGCLLISARVVSVKVQQSDTLTVNRFYSLAKTPAFVMKCVPPAH